MDWDAFLHFHPKTPLVSDREEYSSLSSLGCPSAEDTFSVQKVQNCAALCTHDFASSPRLRGRSSVCVTSLRLINPNSFFFSVVSGNICKCCRTQECSLGFVCTLPRCPGHQVLATAPLSLAALHPCASLAERQSCSARRVEEDTSLPTHPVSCQHLRFVEAAFPPQGLAGPTCR